MRIQFIIIVFMPLPFSSPLPASFPSDSLLLNWSASGYPAERKPLATTNSQQLLRKEWRLSDTSFEGPTKSRALFSPLQCFMESPPTLQLRLVLSEMSLGVCARIHAFVCVCVTGRLLLGFSTQQLLILSIHQIETCINHHPLQPRASPLQTECYLHWFTAITVNIQGTIGSVFPSWAYDSSARLWKSFIVPGMPSYGAGLPPGQSQNSYPQRVLLLLYQQAYLAWLVRIIQRTLSTAKVRLDH